MDNERDIFVYTDENGDSIEMEVLGYFDFEDKQYAMLVIPDDDNDEEDECECCECCCDHDDSVEQEVYIMEVIEKESMYELVPVDNDKLGEIVEYIQAMHENE